MMQAWLDVIYPPLCLGCDEELLGGTNLCPSCWGDVTFFSATCCPLCGDGMEGEGDEPALCDSCLRIERPWVAGRAAIAYAGIGRRLVLGLKHGDRTDLTPHLAGWMAKSAKDILPKNSLLVPIPLHHFRLWRRKYNQAAELARHVGRQLNIPCVMDALIRPAHTVPLDGVSVGERHDRMAGMILPNPKRTKAMEGKDVVLIDDVMTSGATLSVATRAALDGGAASVRVLVLARAQKST